MGDPIVINTPAPMSVTVYRGEVGPTGPTGPAGAAGPAGPPGATDITGTDLSVGSDGSLTIGGDTILYRHSANTLKTDDNFVVAGSTDLAATTVASIFVSGTLNANGAVFGIDKTDVGLANVDNTSDAAKPVSTAAATALALKADAANPTFTGTVTGVTKAHVGLGNADNTSDASKPVSTAQQTALNLKANLASPTFTGTVAGVTKAHVGLGSVDDTSDAAKPVSTAQQTALNLKANAASPAFTGTMTIGAADTNLRRLQADFLMTDDNFVVGQSLYLTNANPAIIAEAITAGNRANVGLYFQVTGEANRQFTLRLNGRMDWGAGGATALDTNLYRSAADTLMTDDSFIVGATLRVNGNAGFYNTAPVAKQTVTGSRGGNAALASLLTALATVGLITNSSTA